MLKGWWRTETAEIFLWTILCILIWNKKMHFNSRNIVTSHSALSDLHEHCALTLWFWCHSSAQEVAWTRRGSLLKANKLTTGLACGCIKPGPWWATDTAYSPWEPSQAIPTLSSLTSNVSAHLSLVQSKGASCWSGPPAPGALLLTRSVSPIPHYCCYHCCHLYYMSAFSWQVRSAAHCAWQGTYTY